MRVATFTRANFARAMTAALAAAGAFIFTAAAPAMAQSVAQPANKIDPADTAWMIVATALVLMMSIPGLALFYSGMVRKKNVLATMAQTFAATALCSVLWMAIGYTLAFTGAGPILGTLNRVMMRGIGMDTISPLAPTIPEVLFLIYQMTFAVITVALVRLQRRFGARRQFARGVCHHRHASGGVDGRADLDGAGMVGAQQALGAGHDLRRGGQPRHHHAGLRLRAAVAGPCHRPGRRRGLLLRLHLAQDRLRL
jgi:hypothetical protein